MRVTRLALFILSLVGASAFAQNPNVLVRLDARLHYRTEKSGDSDLVAYDLMGRHSVVALLFSLEPGFDVTFSERFQKIEGDADDEQLDEYFIEDKGYWRFGKQYLPFGRNIVFRDSVYAGRLNTRIGEKGFPVSICYADGGNRGPVGFVVRIGDRVGVSAALGDRFAQSASSLCVIRRPEDSKGDGHGYGRVIGLDFDIRLAPQVRLKFDHASMRRGAQTDDERLDVTDIAVVWAPNSVAQVELAYSREWLSELSMIRLCGAYPIHDGITIEPFVRFRNSKFYDAALTLRIKP